MHVLSSALFTSLFIELPLSINIKLHYFLILADLLQGSVDYAQPMGYLFWQIKLFWNTATAIYLGIVYGCFHPPVTVD